MQTAIHSSKFQLCIPKEIREQLHFEAGQEFVFIPKGHGIYLAPKVDINDLRGIMKGKSAKNVREHKA